MRQRFNILTLLLTLSLGLSAQQSDGIVHMDQAYATFLQSGELMTKDSHWSRMQDQWHFKYVVPGDTLSLPHALTELASAFAQNVPYATAYYQHTTADGKPPFRILRFSRRDNYDSSVFGWERYEDEDNFYIINITDTAGLTSYSMKWREVSFRDRNGNPWRTIDGVMDKFYGNIWQMEPFGTDNPLENTRRRQDTEANNGTLQFETLRGQLKYLANLYAFHQASNNEQGCDVVAYLLSKLVDGYKGELTEEQFKVIQKESAPLFTQSDNQERQRLLSRSHSNLYLKVEPTTLHGKMMSYHINGGPFVHPDEQFQTNKRYDMGKEKRPQVKVSIQGITNATSVRLAPTNPEGLPPNKTDVDNGRFTFTRNYDCNQLLEIYDYRGRCLIVFADSVPITLNLIDGTLTGSPLNERFAECQRRLHTLEPEHHKYFCLFEGDEQVMDETGFRSMANDAHQLQMQFIRENQDNLIPVWYLTQNYLAMSLKELGEFLRKDRPYADHPGLQPVWQHYEGLLRRKPGLRFHDAECIDTTGVQHHLSEYIGHGDYVVLHFWSPQNTFSRGKWGYLKQLRKQYADKNLHIIGFSLGRDKTAWKKYVQARGLNFVQLSDSEAGMRNWFEEGWPSYTAELYGIDALPETIVFDPKGRIVSTSLCGETLKAFIRTLPLKKK